MAMAVVKPDIGCDRAYLQQDVGLYNHGIERLRRFAVAGE